MYADEPQRTIRNTVVTGIILVTPHLPALGGTGVRMRCGQNLEALSRIAPVHLVVIDERGQGVLDECEPDVRALTASMRVVAPGRAYTAGWAGFRSTTSGLAALMKLPGLPTFGDYAPSPREAALLQEELRALRANVVFAFHLRAAAWFDGFEAATGPWSGVKIVDSDDIQWKMMLRTHRGIWRRSPPLTNLLRIREIYELWRAERRALGWDAVTCCSELDRRVLAARSRRASVHAIPNTVRVPFPPPPVRTPDGCINLVFVGSLGYAPNRDAVDWFARAIWPRIAAALGERVRLLIVGRDPSPSIQALHAPPGVTVTGPVPAVFPYYEAADIVIAPIRFGGGTRIKIIEAWGFARPVVTTTLGAEGLDAVAGEHAAIADCPEAFAAAVIDLAGDAGHRARLGAAGYALARHRYSQQVCDAAVAGIVAEVLGRQG